MGRSRGKGKKQIIVSPRDNPGSGEEEKIPSYRRRGRPQKPLSDYIEDDDDKAMKTEVEDDNAKGSTAIKDRKQSTTEYKRKRKRPSQVKENPLAAKEENGAGNTLNGDGSVKSVGFRKISSRQKSKPRRAAEAGVICK